MISWPMKNELSMPAPAISNIALSAFDHTNELYALADFGYVGLEIAPSRRWHDTWHGLTAGEVNAYRNEIEHAGLRAVGLHSLFFDHPELGLFKDSTARAKTLDYLTHLSGICRDLGGKTLIYGGGRKRGTMDADTAFKVAVDFFSDLCARIHDHGTCFCFEPLGPNDTDFINSALESLVIAEEINHPAVRVQLDAKALIENNEAVTTTFTAVAPMLVHFHANEPGLGVLGSSGKIDHAALGGMLGTIGYNGYISAEQRMLSDDPIADAARSMSVLQACYFNNPDTEAAQ